MYSHLITISKENIFLVANIPLLSPPFTSLVQLVIEAGVGIAVLVRCFVNKKGMEAEIFDTLGNGFTRPPFATVVVHSYPKCFTQC